jgi:polysaccharide biosynthesis/export protein
VLMRQYHDGSTRPLARERNEFQDFVLQSTGRDLPMFGYSLFQGPPTTFAPLDRVPVTPDYVIGPGDEVLIRGWGAVDIDYRAFVERDGTVSIPRVGTVTVAGLKFRDLEPYLKSQIGRVFRNFELNVSLGRLRSMQVFVVGHASRPGAYTVSSFSTLVNAVFASGGPTPKGSMRTIQLRRGDRLVVEYDLYDLLLKGDKSKDAQLLPGDVIHIPPIGPLAAVSGSVNTPAIYELKNEKTLGDLLQLAGGLATTADVRRVIVERILERRGRQVEEIVLDSAGLGQTVRNGDLVTVQQVSPRFDNAITVRGNVAVTARHPYRPGMRVSDVIPDRDALIVPDYWVRRNLIIRADVTGREGYGLRPDLAYDLRFGAWPNTRARIPPRPLPGQAGPDSVQPGQPAMQQPWAGTRREADVSRGFEQKNPALEARQQYEAQLESETRARSQELALEGRASQFRNEITQLPEVNWDYAVIERLNREHLGLQLLPFNLGKAVIDGDPQNNIVLQAGDVVTIFSKEDIQVPVARQSKYVRLEGEVATPGIYQALPGETLRQILARVGGFTKNAYPYGASLTRESVRVQQQRRLDESLNRLSQQVERTAASQAQRIVDAAEAPRAQAQAESNRRLVERLREVRATGRIVLGLGPDAQLRDLPDVVLEDGDRFMVPARPTTVGVIGAVFNQNTFIYDGSKRVSDYLSQAGGPTRDADTGLTYVVRADGTVTPKARSFFSVADERLHAGDTLVVPETLDRFLLTRELKDWTQIFYQFALGVAGLKVLRDF